MASVAMPRESESESAGWPRDVFDGTYSPRRIAFFLHHWDALRSVAEHPMGGRGELDALRREWTIINTTPTILGICACDRRQFYRSTPEEYVGGGAFGPSEMDVAILLADLEHAADALPLHWRATARVFARQGRTDIWGARLATHRFLGLPRRQDRLIEPTDADHRVLGLMALALGWRP